MNKSFLAEQETIWVSGTRLLNCTVEAAFFNKYKTMKN